MSALSSSYLADEAAVKVAPDCGVAKNHRTKPAPCSLLEIEAQEDSNTAPDFSGRFILLNLCSTTLSDLQ
jgi:hypothetical protein